VTYPSYPLNFQWIFSLQRLRKQFYNSSICDPQNTHTSTVGRTKEHHADEEEKEEEKEDYI
jgi:hypothetical protein